MTTPSREVAVDIAHATLLIIDLQNYCTHPDGSWWRGRTPPPHFFVSLRERVVPNTKRLQSLCRENGIESCSRSSRA
jgi:nicotinamidase-related amidase